MQSRKGQNDPQIIHEQDQLEIWSYKLPAALSLRLNYNSQQFKLYVCIYLNDVPWDPKRRGKNWWSKSYYRKFFIIAKKVINFPFSYQNCFAQNRYNNNYLKENCRSCFKKCLRSKIDEMKSLSFKEISWCLEIFSDYLYCI